MARFLITLGSICLTLLGVSVVIFVVLRLVPGDPISMMLPPGATDEVRANLERLYGLDQVDSRAISDLAPQRCLAGFRHVHAVPPAGDGDHP